jgi:hypothetical protein
MSETENALRAEIAVIVEFLKGWGAPFSLAHMKPDTYPRVRNFTDANEAALWAAKTTEDGENIYFHVNPIRQPLSKKASKADMLCLSWLHVDIDPESGETPTQAKARAVDLQLRLSIVAAAFRPFGGCRYLFQFPTSQTRKRLSAGTAHLKLSSMLITVITATASCGCRARSIGPTLENYKKDGCQLSQKSSARIGLRRMM